MRRQTMRVLCGVALATGAPVAAAQGGGQKQADTTKTAAPAMQHGGHEMSGMQAPSAWRQLDAFHKVLAEAWHPAETGDLAPARARAPELLAAARAWQASRGPAACDHPAARAKMTEMLDHLRSYADAARRKASDDAITVTLKSAHDAFEAVAEPCMAAAKK